MFIIIYIYILKKIATITKCPKVFSILYCWVFIISTRCNLVFLPHFWINWINLGGAHNIHSWFVRMNYCDSPVLLYETSTYILYMTHFTNDSIYYIILTVLQHLLCYYNMRSFHSIAIAFLLFFRSSLIRLLWFYAKICFFFSNFFNPLGIPRDRLYCTFKKKPTKTHFRLPATRWHVFRRLAFRFGTPFAARPVARHHHTQPSPRELGRKYRKGEGGYKAYYSLPVIFRPTLRYARV